MVEKSFMTVEEVAAELRVSKSKAYQIVRELNAELQKHNLNDSKHGQYILLGLCGGFHFND